MIYTLLSLYVIEFSLAWNFGYFNIQFSHENLQTNFAKPLLKIYISHERLCSVINILLLICIPECSFFLIFPPTLISNIKKSTYTKTKCFKKYKIKLTKTHSINIITPGVFLLVGLLCMYIKHD